MANVEKNHVANKHVANKHGKSSYVDPGWPEHVAGAEHPVTELVAYHAGACSPYGDETVFPVPASELGYVHPYTRVNS